MKAACFAHVDALCPDVSRAHQEFSFLATTQASSSGSKVNAEHADLIEQLPSDSETCTKRRRLRALKRSGLGTMIEPNKQTVDQRQRLILNPSGLPLTPIRQNPSPKVIGVRETTDGILIGSKPAGSDLYIVVGE